MVVVSANAASFDEQRKAVMASVTTQPESAIMALLKAGLEEGKPVLAIAEAQKWLRQNLPEDAILLYHAGRAAELSGDWKSAAALYQQYLKKADLKSAMADDAVYATYTLLIDRLQDAAGAYAFGRTDGNALLVCLRARQFDQWFLDEAVRRNDATAVAGRLQACIEAGVPDDLLVARYDNYFRWLLNAVDGYIEQPNAVPVTQDLYDTIKDLSAVMTFDEEMSLRLDWAVSVKAYNLARIGGEGAKNVVRKRKGIKKAPGQKGGKDSAVAEQAAVEQALELGDQAVPPIAEAEALLAKYPHYAKWVQDGWAGGGNGQYYRNDSRKYWPHEIDAKMAPILAAVTKLAPLDFAELLQSWNSGNYSSGPNVMEVKAVRDYILANPDLMNSRTGPVALEKAWTAITPEEAQKLAPLLTQNANPLASLICAIAAGGKDFDKVMAALLGPEAWRLGAGELGGNYADQLWHYCGRPGGNQRRDEEIARARALAATFAGGDAKPEDPSATRLAAFKKLWLDYRSPQPKIPGVYQRLVNVLRFSPEVIPLLLKDSSPEVQLLARHAISAGMTGPDPLWKETVSQVNVDAYANIINELARRHTRSDVTQLKTQYPQKFHPHPLEAELRASLVSSLQQNKLDAWQVMAWINMQCPDDNAEQVKLMLAMFKSMAWTAFPSEVKFAAREWFPKTAMTPGQIAWIDTGNPTLICKALLALPKEADATTTFAALSKAIDGAKKSPVKINIEGLDQLAVVSDEVFTDPKVFGQILEIVDTMRESSQSGALIKRLFAVVKKKRDPVVLQRTAGYLWPYIASVDPRSMFEPMKNLTESLIDDMPAAAHALAKSGADALASARNSYGFNPGEHVAEMKTLAGKAAMKLGLVTIPVAPNHPAYPIYKSQAEWLTANDDSAWTMLDESWAQLLPVHREMSLDYLMWVLQRTIYSRDDARQEELIKALLAWAQEANTPLSAQQKLEIDIAYGDIAVQRGMLKDAHEIFKRAAQNKSYDGLMERYESTLRRVRVERMAKDFDAALETLSELEMERVPEMWAPTRYARAEVYYDMEEYDNAADDVDSILERDPVHSEAKIMQGKLQLKRQKLMEATEVELGTVSSQQVMVPGEKLKVTLTDPTLAVSGAGTEIEVVVWATSGDKERFFLRQFGDQKTKFRGEVDTALGAPNPDDRVLQVIGDDEVFYAYSERFRVKMNNMDEKRGGPITVASDALLMASARKLLSEAEQRVADMEAQMAGLNKGRRGASAADRANVQVKMASSAAETVFTGEDVEAGQSRGLEALQKRLLNERIKPGNPIYLRVIDPDRSRTPQIDELTVSVESSTGDSIGQVTLKETGTHTGWFEGTVETAGAQAMASAQNSEPGRNPNMVISPSTGYPAWRPEVSSGGTPQFMVDLNDNVALGELTITAKEQGAKLKKFALQTGMNADELSVVAVYPKNLVVLNDPWRPSVTVMNDTDLEHTRDNRSVYDIRELEQQLDRGWIMQQYAQGVAANVAGPSEAMTNSIPGKIAWKRQERHDTSHVVYRFRGYFYEPAAVTRRFRLGLGKYEIPNNTHPSVNHPAQYMLAVDGRPITDKSKPGNLEGELNLKPGLHRFEIWATGWNTSIGFGRQVKLLANLDGAATWVDCPDRFFDPATFPKGVLPHRNAEATIAANADGTEFKVKFAPESRSRLLNISFMDQEGPAPALNKMTLTDPAGKRVLPVAEDFAALNKNDILEILTGDKVAVRYVDDRFVSRAKEKHERFLNVSFTSAQMQFEFFEVRKDGEGNDVEYYDNLLRFVYGKPVTLTIYDADMDVSANADTLTVTLQSSSGGSRSFVATESGDSTGTFRVQITPVVGAPANEKEIQVAEGGTLTAVYRDEENTDPGVPTDRYASIIHAAFATPELRLSHATVTALSTTNLPGMCRVPLGYMPIFSDAVTEITSIAERKIQAFEARGQGTEVRPRWALRKNMIPITDPPAGGFCATLGESLDMAMVATHLAPRLGSQVKIYVQTDAGRKKAGWLQRPAGTAPEGVQAPVFDIDVPGTLEVTAGLGADWVLHNTPWRQTPQTSIYVPEAVLRPDEGDVTTFRCRVPLIPGVLPDHGVLTAEEIKARALARNAYRPAGLVVQPGERVHVGFRYDDSNGGEQWLTASVKLLTHPVLEVMEEDYRTLKTSAYVGENLYLCVVDLGADITDRSDTVKVLVQAKSGAKYEIELLEVDTHSGVFKGSYALTYVKSASPASAAATEYDVRKEGFPVVYGDVIGAIYTDANKVKTDPSLIRICKGADGSIEPFSKKYDDPDMAMRTQFTLAESYLEVAKNHRALGEEEAAGREYERAKQMLASAMDQFRDPETRAHAEYLLGTLTLEEADTTAEAELKEDRYRAALSRFLNVTGSYPDTVHASKAQFKIATVYEKLEEPDIAAQEYVKLAYKYPNSEFLAIAMARLGTHFQRKAADYEKRAKVLLEQTDDKDAQFEGAATQKMAVHEYLKSAAIFIRLLESFPDHELAGKGGLRGAQAYMRAGENRLAVNVFLRVIGNESYDGPDIRSQAMYWAGMCYESLKEPMAAYSTYKRLTFDFPESKWASYARAQLSQESLLNLESNLEIKRLEEGR